MGAGPVQSSRKGSRPPGRAERFGVPGGHKVLYGPQRAGKWGQVNSVDNGGPFSSSKGEWSQFYVLKELLAGNTRH